MGIKRAIASYGLGLSLLAATTPLHAQEDSDADNVASTRNAEDRADPADRSDPSDQDRALVDPPSLDDIARAVAEYDSVNKPVVVRKARLGARPLDSDSDDNSDIDRDDVDKDDGAPKRDRAVKKDKDVASKDAAKKQPAQKDAPKKDADKSGAAAKPASKKVAGCVDVSSEARYAGAGFDHIVTLKSDCKKAMKCVVRTSVNPEPANVTLAPRGEESVVMWRGSPSQVFTPDVSCD